jgi:hypothetical protein
MLSARCRRIVAVTEIGTPTKASVWYSSGSSGSPLNSTGTNQIANHTAAPPPSDAASQRSGRRTWSSVHTTYLCTRTPSTSSGYTNSAGTTGEPST